MTIPRTPATVAFRRDLFDLVDQLAEFAHDGKTSHDACKPTDGFRLYWSGQSDAYGLAAKWLGDIVLRWPVDLAETYPRPTFTADPDDADEHRHAAGIVPPTCRWCDEPALPYYGTCSRHTSALHRKLVEHGHPGVLCEFAGCGQVNI